MILDPLNLIGFGYLTWVYVFMLNAYLLHRWSYFYTLNSLIFIYPYP
jgi:hypothetical protein